LNKKYPIKADLAVEFDMLTRIIKFKIPLQIMKIRHNTFSIYSPSNIDIKLIDKYMNIRKELGDIDRQACHQPSQVCNFEGCPALVDFKVKDCMRLETLEEGKIYNISVISSKSFRGKKRYLIILARPEGLETNMMINERYVSNSSFEEEYEGTTSLKFVMQTLRIRRGNTGHREMFVKLINLD